MSPHIISSEGTSICLLSFLQAEVRQFLTISSLYYQYLVPTNQNIKLYPQKIPLYRGKVQTQVFNITLSQFSSSSKTSDLGTYQVGPELFTFLPNHFRFSNFEQFLIAEIILHQSSKFKGRASALKFSTFLHYPKREECISRTLCFVLNHQHITAENRLI